MDGPLGGDKAHLVDLLHGAVPLAHDGGDGDLGGLAHVDLILVGIAVVEGQPQLGVVDQLGDGGSLAHRVPHLNIGHLPQVAGVGGGDVELGHLLVDGLQLLLAVVHGLLSIGHRVTGDGVVHAVELLPGGDLVALLDKELQNGARAGGDGGGVLGLGEAVALHRGLDRAAVDRGGHGVAQRRGVPEYKVPHQDNQRDGHRSGHNDSGNGLAASFVLFLGPLGGGRLHRRGEHRGLLFCHNPSSLGWHCLFQLIVAQAAPVGITKQ